MKEQSTKPYLIRAIHEWCSDSGLTPYIVVKVNGTPDVKVPMEHVRNGEIVLNVGADATHKLTMGNDLIQFAARFNGVSREISVPIEAVSAVFAKETGQGLFFETPANLGTDVPASILEGAETESLQPETPAGNGNGNGSGNGPQNGGRRRLQVVK